MLNRRIVALIAMLMLAPLLLSAGDSVPQGKDSKLPPMDKETRMLVIRSLMAETVFVRKPLPMYKDGLTLKDGVITPDDQQLGMLIAQYGFAAKPGDRAHISDVKIERNRIHVEINGGAKKKTKWYQHIQVQGIGGSVPLAKDDSTIPKGSCVDIVFDKYVPEMTGDQVRALLSPILDFNAHSAVEAYLDTVPPKVKRAIKDHQVLVGMNHEMVTYAMGRPDNKIREKDEQGNEYEEWIYGRPPKPVTFVRFIGDQVTRLELMNVDGTKIVRTQREVDITPVKVKVVENKVPLGEGPGSHPTLKRPGETQQDTR
jgi:hypothetical protein